MTDDERALLEDLIGGLTDRQPFPWLRVVINLEIRDVEGEDPDLDSCFFTVLEQSDGTLAIDQSVDREEEDEEIMIEMRRRMARREGDAWSVMDLEVDSDGTYRVDFNYGEPKRLNAILDEKSFYRFQNYLDTFERSQPAG